MWGKKGVKKGGRKGVAKKGWKKSKRGFNTKLTVNRAIQPYAQRYICTMKYAESVGLTTNASILAQHNFNLNSIFDPNRTGIGHQPYGRDELYAIYNRYRVIGCKYTISAYNAASSGDAYSVIAALPSNEEVSLSGGLPQAQETPRCKYITQAPNAPLRVLQGYVNLPALVGATKTQYMTDDDYQANFDSSPASFAILNIYAGAITGASETNTTKLNVVLEYTVECFDPKQLPGS